MKRILAPVFYAATLTAAAFWLPHCSSGATSHAGTDQSRDESAVGGGLRLNGIRAKSSHNSYGRDEPLVDQISFDRVHALELDLWTFKLPAGGLMYRNWYISHGPTEGFPTNCNHLTDCLDVLRAYHDTHPNHEVLHITYDLKSQGQPGSYWKDNLMPEDLDAVTLEKLGAENVFRPKDLIAACGKNSNTLQETVTGECDWPLVDSLRGKFIFTTTGDDGTLSDYAGNDDNAAQRVVFLCPNVDGKIVQGDPTRDGRAICFNMPASKMDSAAPFRAAGFMTRVYDLNTPDEFQRAKDANVNWLATDKINDLADPWSRTRNDFGYPFECIDRDCSGRSGPASLIHFAVRSDADIWDYADSFAFAHDRYTADASEHVWVANVGTAKSHTEDWAKGCLMARAPRPSDDSAMSAPYFAVCRPSGQEKIRVQFRRNGGDPTEARNSTLTDAGPDIPEDSFSNLQLTTYNGGTCARGAASIDGISWVTIADECFGESLMDQGFAASSHGGDWVKFEVDTLTRDGAVYARNSFQNLDAIGGAECDVHDGF